MIHVRRGAINTFATLHTCESYGGVSVSDTFESHMMQLSECIKRSDALKKNRCLMIHFAGLMRQKQVCMCFPRTAFVMCDKSLLVLT